MDYDKLAAGLLHKHRAIDLADGPKARQIAAAHFNGMCDAANRLGIGMTPDAVHLAVLDVVRSAEPRPAYNPTDTTALKAYDAEQAAFLANVLRDLP